MPRMQRAHGRHKAHAFALRLRNVDEAFELLDCCARIHRLNPLFYPVLLGFRPKITYI